MLERILELCSQQNITVAALEAKLGFGNGTIKKWKKSEPSVLKLKKVADYFGVSIDYFFEDTEKERNT